ncbi:MAG TPA: PEP-CTERM sorting domain-containing protein [Bryobacteraceae bacterium]|jgi:hypothetical protein
MRRICLALFVLASVSQAATIVGNVGDDLAFNNYMNALGAPGFAGWPPTVDYTNEVFAPQGRIGNDNGSGTNEIGLHRNNPPDSTPPTNSSPLPGTGSIQYTWGSSGFANSLVSFQLSRTGSTISFSFGTNYQASFTDPLAADVNFLAFRTRAEATATTSRSQALLTGMRLNTGSGFVAVPDSAALDSTVGNGAAVENLVIRDLVGDFVLTGRTTLNWDGATPSGSALAWQIKSFRDIPGSPVPEPATFALAGASLVLAVLARRRK